jgi:hypothetical protein
LFGSIKFKNLFFGTYSFGILVAAFFLENGLLIGIALFFSKPLELDKTSSNS